LLFAAVSRSVNLIPPYVSEVTQQMQQQKCSDSFHNGKNMIKCKKLLVQLIMKHPNTQARNHAICIS
jgi:hypothetical protein